MCSCGTKVPYCSESDFRLFRPPINHYMGHTVTLWEGMLIHFPRAPNLSSYTSETDFVQKHTISRGTGHRDSRARSCAPRRESLLQYFHRKKSNSNIESRRETLLYWVSVHQTMVAGCATTTLSPVEP
jgi:hypothetical protein